ncbi:cupin domain-containing protein [Alphaproteobacteria bacterium]|nr:cupin domain-containing protein [Alphaproteobacteria bacterium]
MTKHVNLYSKFDKFEDHWSPKVIAEMNDYQFKLVKIKGEFVKHQHPETDEVFIVIEGRMKIEFDTETIEIKCGEMIVVPKGVAHKPFADEECKVMLVEPKGILNTGDTQGDLTAPNNQWI